MGDVANVRPTASTAKAVTALVRVARAYRPYVLGVDPLRKSYSYVAGFGADSARQIYWTAGPSVTPLDRAGTERRWADRPLVGPVMR